ncbi:MAG: polymer-forming cytoskeletal protein [Myxococcales bacterium]|nr:polymer-forming cytoskeletal protein [Myxococcales bacterium]MCB9645539.1 polymer-forming cytoskeletal protein [Deltaproteobacteria bacterium]
MAEATGTIGKGIKVRGEITGTGALEVAGEVEGRVALDRLVVHGGGTVAADVQVSELVIAGRAAGQLVASKRLEVRASAQVEGDVRAPSLVVEEGAVFKGRVHMDTGIPEDV